MAHGVPACPKENCDGHLHREFRSGLNQSTSQIMRLAGLALIAGPVVFGAPFFADYVVRRSAGMGAMVGTVVGLLIPIVVGTVILHRRRERMRERTEQQRCNKCGSVFPAGG